MTDIQTILQAIDELPADELRQVRQQVEKRETVLAGTPRQRTSEEIEAMIARLDALTADFREGLTAEEWEVAEKAMNGEHVEWRPQR